MTFSKGLFFAADSGIIEYYTRGHQMRPCASCTSITCFIINFHPVPFPTASMGVNLRPVRNWIFFLRKLFSLQLFLHFILFILGSGPTVLTVSGWNNDFTFEEIRPLKVLSLRRLSSRYILNTSG